MIERYLWNNKSEYIVIPWSGGVDSTNIFLKVLNFIERNEEDSKKIKNVILVSATSSTMNQHKNESYSREKIKKYIDKKYKHIKDKIIYTEYNENMSGYDTNNKTTLHQPYFWITHLLGHYNNSTILLGYHKGDDFWLMSHLFHTVVKTSLEYLDRKNVDIYYPLAGMYKDEIYNELPNKIKKSIWYCGNVIDDKICNNCASCKTDNKFIKGIK